MQTQKTIAPHETFQLHELLSFKNLCATKSATMSTLVGDEQLKSLMEQDFNTTKSHIRELQDLMQGSQYVVQ